MNSEYTKLSFPLQPIPFQKGQQVPKKKQCRNSSSRLLPQSQISLMHLGDWLQIACSSRWVPPSTMVQPWMAANWRKLLYKSLAVYKSWLQWNWMGPVASQHGTHGNFGLLIFMSLSDRSTHGFHACATLCRTSSVNSVLFAFCSVLVPLSIWNKECHQKHYI